MQSDRAPKLRLPNVLAQASSENAVAVSWSLFVYAWEATQDEQHQADLEVQEDASSKPRKKAGRRRKSVVAKHDSSLDEDDEDFVEGFAG